MPGAQGGCLSSPGVAGVAGVAGVTGVAGVAGAGSRPRLREPRGRRTRSSWVGPASSFWPVLGQIAGPPHSPAPWLRVWLGRDPADVVGAALRTGGGRRAPGAPWEDGRRRAALERVLPGHRLSAGRWGHCGNSRPSGNMAEAPRGEAAAPESWEMATGAMWKAPARPRARVRRPRGALLAQARPPRRSRTGPGARTAAPRGPRPPGHR